MPSSSSPSTRNVLYWAMNLSLAVGVVMLAAKWTAYLLTGSSVIFSDAAESVVHIVAVWFAWYAIRLTERPPDAEHHYGHEKIAFISAGVEGALICIAAVVIIGSAIQKLVAGVELQRLDIGMSITAGAGALNALLGWYLIRTGRNNHSLTVEANGKHVMTDAWTSAGAVLGLILAQWTGLLWLDPVMAILFGANILWEGGRLVITSVDGLLDRTDAALEQRAHNLLTDLLTHQLKDTGVTYHRLRLRMSGHIPHIDFHLQFPDEMPIAEAHQIATDIEEQLRLAMQRPNTEVFTHLEPTTHPGDHP